MRTEAITLLDDRCGVAAAAVVDEKDRLQVGARGGQQREPILDGIRHDVLVGKDHAPLRSAQRERAENAALPASVLLLHLLEHVDGRVGVATQGSIGDPCAQRLGGVLVRPFGPAVVLAGKDEPNDVVRICRREGARLGFLDDVVGR